MSQAFCRGTGIRRQEMNFENIGGDIIILIIPRNLKKIYQVISEKFSGQPWRAPKHGATGTTSDQSLHILKIKYSYL